MTLSLSRAILAPAHALGRRRAWGHLCVFVFALNAPLEALAGETWVTAGAGGSDETLYSYVGLTHAPLGALAEAGLRARIWGKGLRFNAQSERANAASLAANIQGYGADAELGWQFIGPHWRAALYGGAVWRVEATKGERFGGSVGIDASWQMSGHWRVLAGAKHTFGLNETWAHVKPEIRFGNDLFAGLVASANKGQGYSVVRGGGSLSGLHYSVPWIGKAYLSFEAGIEYNVTTKKNGPFGALHIGFAY